MTYVPTNWVDGSTPLNRTNMMKIENELALLDGGLSATPPGSPVDGQLWEWPFDTASGTVWTFRYNAGSASAYKWEFVGGSPFLGRATDTLGNTNTWTAYFPGVALARAGEYLCESTLETLTAQAATAVTQGPWVSGVGVQPPQYTNAYQATAGQAIGVAPCRNVLTVTAGQTVVIGAHGGAGGVTLSWRSLSVVPKRVS